MIRNFGIILGMASLFALGACGDDSGTTPKNDKGGIRLDGGGPTPDTGTTNTETCSQLVTCAAACQDQTCIAACVAKGTPAAQTAFTALETCLSGAIAGACKADCTSATDPKCGPCLQTACATEYDVCAGGTGSPDAGFGDKCDQATPCTNSAMTCLTSQGATSGYCTKTCTNSGQQCSGAPSGTAAFCIASTGTETFCAFLCKAQGQEWTCPSTLACSSTENPPSSGQFGCE